MIHRLIKHTAWFRSLQRHVLIRLFLPVLLGLLMLATVLVDLATGHTPVTALILLFPGFLVGFPFGRLTKVAWDSEKSQVVLLGRQLLVFGAYLSVRLSLRLLLSEHLAGVSFAVDVISLFSIGSMFGYSWGLSQRVRGALKTSGRQSLT